jgi:hypothetical protein
LGSILFLVAAFLPVSRVYVEPLAEKKIEIITAMKRMWNTGQILFGSGSIVTVIALGILSYGFRDSPSAKWSYLGVSLMAVGAVLWNWHVAERIIDPVAFANNTNTPYLFVMYSILTQAGMVFIGIMLLNSIVANWVGWTFIIGSVFFLLMLIIFKDVPPFVYYVLTMIAAVVLFFG